MWERIVSLDREGPKKTASLLNTRTSMRVRRTKLESSEKRATSLSRSRDSALARTASTLRVDALRLRRRKAVSISVVGKPWEKKNKCQTTGNLGFSPGMPCAIGARDISWAASTAGGQSHRCGVDASTKN